MIKQVSICTLIVLGLLFLWAIFSMSANGAQYGEEPNIQVGTPVEENSEIVIFEEGECYTWGLLWNWLADNYYEMVLSNSNGTGLYGVFLGMDDSSVGQLRVYSDWMKVDIQKEREYGKMCIVESGVGMSVSNEPIILWEQREKRKQVQPQP